MYRQGDLLFTALQHLLEGVLARPSQVIAQGEAAGHSHRLAEDQVLKDAQGHLFLNVSQPTHIVHQEHHAIHLGPEYYVVTRQREYTPTLMRMVRD